MDMGHFGIVIHPDFQASSGQYQHADLCMKIQTELLLPLPRRGSEQLVIINCLASRDFGATNLEAAGWLAALLVPHLLVLGEQH
jgi:hypothetical protein